MIIYVLNACPPLLVGVGIGTSVKTVSLNSKLSLICEVDSISSNKRVAKMEKTFLRWYK